MAQEEDKPARKLLASEMGRASVEEFRRQEKLPVTIVLDNVRSMHNVGSIFRTADAFAVERIFLCGITGCPPHREIEKTALGATQSVSWSHYEQTSTATSELKQAGYLVLAVEQAAGSVRLDRFTPLSGKKIALVFGNEVNGVDDEVLGQADSCIEIPQFGTKHSFNIVVSAGIVLWDLYGKIS